MRRKVDWLTKGADSAPEANLKRFRDWKESYCFYKKQGDFLRDTEQKIWNDMNYRPPERKIIKLARKVEN